MFAPLSYFVMRCSFAIRRCAATAILALVASIASVTSTPVFAQQSIVYVDGTSSNTTAPSTQNPGDSWGSAAYKYLQNGLVRADQLLAGQNPPDDVGIWVRGASNGSIVYYPDDGNGITPGDREATFRMRNNVAIYGGFDTEEQGSLADQFLSRRPSENITILSGDIDGNDTLDDDNSFHVVTAMGVTTSAIIDGFVIRMGWAVDAEFDEYPGFPNPTEEFDGIPDGGGAGMFIVGRNNHTFFISAAPVVLRCTFEYNKAARGGGIFFHGNQSSGATFQNCVFRSNEATVSGGGFYNYGMSLSGLQPPPACAGYGGATIVNGLFHDNDAANDGGAYWGDHTTSLTLIGSTIAYNSTGVFQDVVNSCGTVTVRNAIIYFNGSGDELEQIDGQSDRKNSDVQDMAGGSNGNIDEDPEFDDPNGADNIAGNADDDYRLSSINSPCVDMGNTQVNCSQDWLDQWNLLQNVVVGTEPAPDLDHKTRVIRKSDNSSPLRLDIGAYEFGDPCAAGDADRNGVVNVADILFVIVEWGLCPGGLSPCPADVTYFVLCPDTVVSTVDVNDILVVISTFGMTCDPGEPEDLPESLEDCYELADQTCVESEDPDCWIKTYQACVNYLCQMSQIPCE